MLNGSSNKYMYSVKIANIHTNRLQSTLSSYVLFLHRNFYRHVYLQFSFKLLLILFSFPVFYSVARNFSFSPCNYSICYCTEKLIMKPFSPSIIEANWTFITEQIDIFIYFATDSIVFFDRVWLADCWHTTAAGCSWSGRLILCSKWLLKIATPKLATAIESASEI